MSPDIRAKIFFYLNSGPSQHEKKVKAVVEGVLSSIFSFPSHFR